MNLSVCVPTLLVDGRKGCSKIRSHGFGERVDGGKRSVDGTVSSLILTFVIGRDILSVFSIGILKKHPVNLDAVWSLARLRCADSKEQPDLQAGRFLYFCFSPNEFFWRWNCLSIRK